MIFVFVEDGSLEIVSDIDDGRKNCEGIDVESSVFQFFDENGQFLEPRFTKPNKKGRFLGIFEWIESGEFELVPADQSISENIFDYLNETSDLKPNLWFSSLDEVRRYLEGRVRR